eukprot:601033-Prymnesium_polylepis.1
MATIAWRSEDDCYRSRIKSPRAHPRIKRRSDAHHIKLQHELMKSARTQALPRQLHQGPHDRTCTRTRRR